MEIYYTRNAAGAWELSTLARGYRIARTYYGHTKSEATRLFRQYIKEINV